MAQNITLLGASYSDCPAVLLPKTGGGTARFDDASITTATASDVASGKIFVASDGTITTGTATGGGGGGAITQDQDGYLVLSTQGGGGGGISISDLAQNLAPTGAITLDSSITTILDYALAGKPITSITASGATDVKVNALQNTQITNIADANFPALGVSTQYNIYLRMSSLQHIKLTGEKISLASGSGALRDNTALVSAEFPNCAKSVGSGQVGTGSSCFNGCSNLEVADLGLTRSIAGQTFYNCAKLTTIVLRYTSVVSLASTNALTNTPFKSGGAGGTIYIPKVLYDALGTGTNDYQSASNWSTYHGYGTITWAKIEGSIYE